GRPRTGAMETDAAIKSPSPEKTRSNGEKRASVTPPRQDEVQADRVAEEAELSGRGRRHSDHAHSEEPALRSPRLKKAKAAPATERGPESPERTPAPKSDKDRPQGIERPERPDDLKMISGVGPKIEGILNDLGIYTYAQIAKWKKAEREWVDSYLRFKGRIERDDWVKQAKALAKGGAAEYERVFGKKPR
ncbi:NADH-quinone oxidoreductase subunit E, partial [Nitratireductor sp. GCM10026969]